MKPHRAAFGFLTIAALSAASALQAASPTPAPTVAPTPTPIATPTPTPNAWQKLTSAAFATPTPTPTPTPSVSATPTPTPTAAKATATGGFLQNAASLLTKSDATGISALSTDTITAGLKAGLGTGVDRALAELGKADGFFANAGFKIPLPAELAKGEKTLRKLGQDKLADDLILALNRAAEKSVAETAPIFKDAITAMTLADARAILAGPKDAATTYFRKATETQLRAKMLPIVQTATEANGVGSTYKQFAGKAAPVASLFGVKSVDLDSYVCDHALDSLFQVIATQEAALRTDPAGTADKLLRTVFGAAKK